MLPLLNPGTHNAHFYLRIYKGSRAVTCILAQNGTSTFFISHESSYFPLSHGPNHVILRFDGNNYLNQIFSPLFLNRDISITIRVS